MSATTGFEALPPRAEGRAAKRRRPAEASVPAPQSQASAAPAAALPAGASSAALPRAGGAYEFLDHTADVQVHSWAPSQGEAFAQCALGMFGYMTEPETVRERADCARELAASGRDAVSLLFNFLDACLFAFAADDFVARSMRVEEFVAGAEKAACGSAGSSASGGAGGCASGDADSWRIRVFAFGERFELGRHPQGTEVKAITYSNMQVVTPSGTATANGDDGGGGYSGGRGGGGAPPAGERRAPYECYAIIDI